MAEGGAEFWAVNPLVVSQKMASGAVLMDTASGSCFELNEVGAEIWIQLGKNRSFAVIVETLAQTYRMPLAQVTADTRRLLEQLVAHGMLRTPLP